jgi:hypothetical protein
LAKNSSFGFFCVGFRVGKNQMCCLCGWLFSLWLTARATRRPGFLKLIFSSHFTKIAPAAKGEIGAAWLLLSARTLFLFFHFQDFTGLVG